MIYNIILHIILMLNMTLFSYPVQRSEDFPSEQAGNKPSSCFLRYPKSPWTKQANWCDILLNIADALSVFSQFNVWLVVFLQKKGFCKKQVFL